MADVITILVELPLVLQEQACSNCAGPDSDKGEVAVARETTHTGSASCAEQPLRSETFGKGEILVTLGHAVTFGARVKNAWGSVPERGEWGNRLSLVADLRNQAIPIPQLAQIMAINPKECRATELSNMPTVTGPEVLALDVAEEDPSPSPQ